METISREIVRHAQQLARRVDARAVVLYADAMTGDDELSRLVQAVDFPTILVTRSRVEAPPPGFGSAVWVRVPDVHMNRAGQVRTALLVCLARGVLHKGDRVICLSGVDRSRALDTLSVLELGGQPELLTLFDSESFGGDLAPEVFERVLTLATQLAVEGREGQPVGALFVLGDSERVLGQSRSLVLNPFQGHPESGRNVLDPALEETLKEFAALDGAFIVRGDGVVLTAGSRLMPSPAASTHLASGLGTRHGAAAGISASTDSVAICISQSTGTVSVYKSGHLVTDIQRPTHGRQSPI
jgi:DNA integrity scanning protein DisA with diadenylate cyclase activity